MYVCVYVCMYVCMYVCCVCCVGACVYVCVCIICVHILHPQVIFCTSAERLPLSPRNYYSSITFHKNGSCRLNIYLSLGGCLYPGVIHARSRSRPENIFNSAAPELITPPPNVTSLLLWWHTFLLTYNSNWLTKGRKEGSSNETSRNTAYLRALLLQFLPPCRVHLGQPLNLTLFLILHM